VLEESHQVAQLDGLPILQPLLFRPGNEFVEQGSVGSLSMLRLPALVAEVLQKIFEERLQG
jgi:hypothetical protein